MVRNCQVQGQCSPPSHSSACQPHWPSVGSIIPPSWVSHMLLPRPQLSWLPQSLMSPLSRTPIILHVCSTTISSEKPCWGALPWVGSPTLSETLKAHSSFLHSHCHMSHYESVTIGYVPSPLDYEIQGDKTTTSLLITTQTLSDRSSAYNTYLLNKVKVNVLRFLISQVLISSKQCQCPDCNYISKTVFSISLASLS